MKNYSKQFEEESVESEHNESNEGEEYNNSEPEYKFEGYDIEFIEKIFLNPSNVLNYAK